MKPKDTSGERLAVGVAVALANALNHTSLRLTRLADSNCNVPSSLESPGTRYKGNRYDWIVDSPHFVSVGKRELEFPGFNRLEPSMSRRGNCWDNAVAESFFSSLKKERIKKRIYKTRALAETDVADYIDKFYNRTRHHSYLGGVSPEQFEAAHKRRRRGLH